MKKGSAVANRRVAGLMLMALALTPVAFGAGKRTGTAAEYGKLPLSFEENRGQTDARVKFLSRGSGYALFLTPTDAVLSLTAVGADKKSVTTSVRMGFAGAREATVSAVAPQEGRSNYFIGSDSSQWLKGVRQFGRVRYEGLYPGIDAVFYGNQRQMEYDFVVAPGADPKKIRLQFEGARAIKTDSRGDLVLTTALGEMRQLRPVIYQETGGKRKTIDGRYRVKGSEVSFEIARYDRTKPLVIDPVLQWATFFGGTGADTALSLAVDGANSVIVAGFTSSADFNAAIRFIGGSRGGVSDAFVTKFNNLGTQIVWSTFMGGSTLDEAIGVAVDDLNAVYVTGRTDSTNFPMANALQSTVGGGTDAFIAKLSSTGSELAYSTFLGGFGDEQGNDIEVDSKRQAAVVGSTGSINFWALRGPYGFSSGRTDAFVTKVTDVGTGIVWSTYLGGTQDDYGYGIAVDSTDAVYVTGATLSFSFPTSGAAVQRSIGSVGIGDAFVTKINANGLIGYSTFLGGTAFDEGTAIAVDATGSAYVFGNTESPNYPTVAPIQAANAGNRDAFLTRLNPAGSARVYSTYIGGAGIEQAGDMVLSTTGVVTLVGATTSAANTFPLVNAFQITNNGGSDAFVTEVNAAGTGYISSTFLGGTGDDFAYGVDLDAAGNIYLAGTTLSFNFPVLNPLQPLFAGTQDAFVAKLSNCVVTLSPLRGVTPGILHTNAAISAQIAITGPTDCNWVAQSGSSWITLTGVLSGSGNGVVNYTIPANTGAPRRGFISIAGVRFDIEQQGAPLAVGCIYPPEPSSVIAAASATNGSFVLGTTNAACPWTAVSTVPWIQVFPTSGTDTTTITYTVFPNFSNRVRSGEVVIGTHRFIVTQANSFLTEAQRFVTLVYFNFLGRYPSQAEIDFQTAVLNTTVRADLVASFFNTPEFQAGGRFVAGLYPGLLARDSEFGGWLFQRNSLAVGATNQDQLVSNFINSPEFALKWGALSNDAFVNLLYSQVLGRAGSAGEVAGHVAALVAGTTTRVSLASAFLNSLEFRTRLAARLSAFLLYATLLQRDASPGELTNREVQIGAGTPIRTLAEQFITSPEFLLQLL